jgi:hypothetical protein
MYPILVYADDDNILLENITTIKQNLEAVLQAGGEFRLDLNTKETKDMLRSRQQNAGQNNNIPIDNKSLEDLAIFVCLGMTVKKSKLLSGRN